MAGSIHEVVPTSMQEKTESLRILSLGKTAHVLANVMDVISQEGFDEKQYWFRCGESGASFETPDRMLAKADVVTEAELTGLVRCETCFKDVVDPIEFPTNRNLGDSDTQVRLDYHLSGEGYEIYNFINPKVPAEPVNADSVTPFD